MSILDHADNRPKTKATASRSTGDWEEFSKELFDKCLSWPDGPIHSNERIKQIAENFVELVESISYFHFTSFETKDIRDFFKDYGMQLAVLEAGPGKPNGFHLAFLKPKEQSYKDFVAVAKEVIEDIEQNLTEIEIESRQAMLAHQNKTDTEIVASDPQMKSRIPITEGLASSLENLRRIVEGKPIIAAPPTTGQDRPPNTDNNRGEMGLAS